MPCSLLSDFFFFSCTLCTLYLSLPSDTFFQIEKSQRQVTEYINVTPFTWHDYQKINGTLFSKFQTERSYFVLQDKKETKSCPCCAVLALTLLG